MSNRNILIIEKEKSEWAEFLESYFKDISVELTFVHESLNAVKMFSQVSPDIVFVNDKFLTMPLIQKIKVKKEMDSSFRIFCLQNDTNKRIDCPFDKFFLGVPPLYNFEKHFVETLPLPEEIRILVADDEPEVGFMINDYFDRRFNPSFKIDYASNGSEALQAVNANKPDVIILDIKMPIMDGRGFYREIQNRTHPIPVIIFFDAISSDELSEMRKYGNPAVVEKGTEESSLPTIMMLAKRFVYFG